MIFAELTPPSGLFGKNPERWATLPVVVTEPGAPGRDTFHTYSPLADVQDLLFRSSFGGSAISRCPGVHPTASTAHWSVESAGQIADQTAPHGRVGRPKILGQIIFRQKLSSEIRD